MIEWVQLLLEPLFTQFYLETCVLLVPDGSPT